MLKIDEWKLTITRVDNGYILSGKFGDSEIREKIIIEDDENDELRSHEELLYKVMEYFGFQSSKHDAERLAIIREKREE